MYPNNVIPIITKLAILPFKSILSKLSKNLICLKKLNKIKFEQSIVILIGIFHLA